MKKNYYGIWLFAISLLLILPSYWYFLGLNITYIYPILLFLIFAFMNRGKVPVPTKIKYKFYIIFLLYLCVVASVQKGILYGFVTFASTIGVIYLIIASVKTKKALLKFIHCIVIVTFVSCLIGIIEALTSVNIFHMLSSNQTEFFIDYRMGHIRISSQFAQPIVLGLFLILVSPLIVYIITETTKKRKLYFYRLVYILMWVSVILTSSRAPIMAFLLLQMVFLYIIKKKKIFLALFGVLVAILLLFITDSIVGLGFMKKFNSFFELFSSLANSSDSNNAMGVGNRLELFEWVSKTVKNNIWFGNGINTNFEYKVYSWQVKESIENEYLNTFFHYGIVGVVLQISAYLSVVCIGFKSAKRIGNNLGKFNLAKAITISLLVFYITIITSGQSSAITTHIFMVAILIVLERMNKLFRR